MISATGRTAFDPSGHLTAERKRGLHVATEVEVVVVDHLAIPLRVVSNSSPLVRSVRNARNAGLACWFRNTVSVSATSTIACFQFSWIGDSAAETIRVPS